MVDSLLNETRGNFAAFWSLRVWLAEAQNRVSLLHDRPEIAVEKRMVGDSAPHLVAHAIEGGFLEQERELLYLDGDESGLAAVRVELVELLAYLRLQLCQRALAHLERILHRLEPLEGRAGKLAYPEQVIVLVDRLVEENLVVKVQLKVLAVVVSGEELLQELRAEEELQLDLCQEEIDAWES